MANALRCMAAVVTVCAVMATLVAVSALEAGHCDAASAAEDPICQKLHQQAESKDVDPGAAAEETEMMRELEDTVSTASRLGLLLALFGGLLAWICAVIKFAIDGSLPARLALWGLLPEVCAAVSVRSLVALLRLKTEPTPAIVLRSCVNDDGAKRLADGIREYGARAELQVIELSNNPQLGKEGLRTIGSASMAEGLQVAELDLSYNPQLGDHAVYELAPLLQMKTSKISALKLVACSISPTGLEVLAKHAVRSRLRTLDLGRNELAGTGEVLANICEAPVLEELALSCCGLKVSDIKELAEQLPYTSIRSLQLGGNGFGSAGLVALAEHLPKSQIDELGLEFNKIEYEALSDLGTAWAKRPFARVSLRGNSMAQEQVAAFINTLKSLNA
mmetsp:Transcript_114466/g.323645  ORF Transcript_114466/g.323645 Transcript_114466/m.323645 type:complete len:391 (+) Transcript_114466:101-1273(+)